MDASQPPQDPTPTPPGRKLAAEPRHPGSAVDRLDSSRRHPSSRRPVPTSRTGCREFEGAPPAPAASRLELVPAPLDLGKCDSELVPAPLDDDEQVDEDELEGNRPSPGRAPNVGGEPKPVEPVAVSPRNYILELYARIEANAAESARIAEDFERIAKNFERIAENFKKIAADEKSLGEDIRDRLKTDPGFRVLNFLKGLVGWQ